MSEDYKPRTRPLIPAGHRTWLAVSRVKNPSITAESTVDEKIEWLLEWVTRPGERCYHDEDYGFDYSIDFNKESDA